MCGKSMPSERRRPGSLGLTICSSRVRRSSSSRRRSSRSSSRTRPSRKKSARDCLHSMTTDFGEGEPARRSALRSEYEHPLFSGCPNQSTYPAASIRNRDSGHRTSRPMAQHPTDRRNAAEAHFNRACRSVSMEKDASESMDLKRTRSVSANSLRPLSGTIRDGIRVSSVESRRLHLARRAGRVGIASPGLRIGKACSGT